MQYQAAIKSYDPDDEAMENFDTWQKAADWLADQSRYFRGLTSMWVNDKAVVFRDGELVYEQSLSQSQKARLAADFDRMFRPQPARPVNPSTLLATNKLEG